MLDRPKGGERTILVQITLPDRESVKALAEFEELALSAQAEVVAIVEGSRIKPDARYYVGPGKAEEISEQVVMHQAELVLINHDLSPSQERNLERLLQCRVVGRSGLILDIFAQRARTFEGKLQVELAQLQHLSTRLIRGWTHLERQKGGIGLRGPGETQLETDRRLLRDRIRTINKRLEKVRQTREENRRSRKKSGMLTVSLVGYTNAGKSTLFNQLTQEETFVANKLFATLDPTMRKLNLPGAIGVILADTVGFIRDLPHQLVEAFRATLEETEQASLLLHVIDASDPHWPDTVTAVETVLEDIGVKDIPMVQVFNKIDKIPGCAVRIEEEELPHKIWLSATTGMGCRLLRELIVQELYGKGEEKTVHLGAHESKLRAQLYELNAVLEEKADEEGGWHLIIKLTAPQEKKLFESN